MKRKVHIWFLFLDVIIFVLYPTIKIAHAQTRPSRLRGTIKTKLSRMAVIEKPAFALKINGFVINSDGKPAFARVIALPNTSYGARITLNNKNGYFEIPWSSTWLNGGQAIQLIAKSGHMAPRGEARKNEAAIVEITDPTQPVTIRLEYAPELIGKVTDIKGQRLEKYTATLSLARKFKCQAPIFETTGGSWGERIFKLIPYGAKYKLTIKAEGYQTKQVTVDATDRSKKVINLGTIILRPQDSTKSHVKEQGPNPVLTREFNDIYHLDEGEIVKFIKPPFVLGRQEYLLSNPNYSSFALQHPGHHIGFHWDNELKMHSLSSSNSLGWILYYVLDVSEYDYNLPKDLKINLPGDWIVRTDATKEEQLRALEQIIHAETNRVIHLVKHKVESEVIVAKGQYEFKPHPNGLYPNHTHVTFDGTLANWERKVDSLEKFFSRLEYYIKMKIVDETEPMKNTPIQYKESKNLAWLGDSDDVKEKYLDGFLFNLSMTTSLKFTVEKRPTKICFVTETKEN